MKFKTIPNCTNYVHNGVEFAQVPTALVLADKAGGWKARWAIGRMKYAIGPGLYAVGEPGAESPVLVSANYKMSFDRLRRELTGIDAWIMVIDTDGINVWCAAGKGTFGTEEIVRRIEAVGLKDVVSHRKLIVPQLGAPGVSAHEVRDKAEFRVVYGPIRAADLPVFLESSMKANEAMRRVRFGIWQRIVTVPVEFVMSLKYVAIVAACFFLLAGLNRDGYSVSLVMSRGLFSAGLLAVTFLAAVIFGPALLPWLGGKAFSLKGLWIGVALAAGLVILSVLRQGLLNNVSLVGWMLMIPAVSSFVVMNFTGASTYTSLSGVRREMRIAVPIQLAAVAAGVILWVVGLFL